MKTELTQERLKELLNYDPDTGCFTWKERTKKKGMNSRLIGNKAGYITRQGYINIVVDFNQYKGHRLAWLYMTGAWPIDQIDHINSIRDDNKFSNLREADLSQNQQNQKTAAKNNKSTGILGVYYHENSNRFRAHIGVHKKQKTIGWFKTLEEAEQAYIKAKRELHPFGML